MQATDNEFFEKYKQLDKLCSEIYRCNNGISEYITEMECKAYIGKYRVSSWDYDYKTLMRVRSVRNKIAHDYGLYQISQPEDLAFVQDFYDRIFTCQDSLSQLRKLTEAKSKPKIKQTKESEQAPINDAAMAEAPVPSPSRKSKSRFFFAAFILIVISLAVLMCCLFR